MTKKKTNLRARIIAAQAPEPALDYLKITTEEILSAVEVLQYNVKHSSYPAIVRYCQDRLAEAWRVLDMRGVKIEN